MFQEGFVCFESELQVNELLADLFWDLERIFQYLIPGWLLIIRKIHLGKVRLSFLLLVNGLLDQGLIGALGTVLDLLAILDICFIAFALFFQEVLISVVKGEDFLDPLESLFKQCLFLQEFNDHKILAIKLLSQVFNYLVFLIDRLVQIARQRGDTRMRIGE